MYYPDDTSDDLEYDSSERKSIKKFKISEDEVENILKQCDMQDSKKLGE